MFSSLLGRSGTVQLNLVLMLLLLQLLTNLDLVGGEKVYCFVFSYVFFFFVRV